MLNQPETLVICENSIINSSDDMMKLTTKLLNTKGIESENIVSNEDKIDIAHAYFMKTRPDLKIFAGKNSLTISTEALNSYSRIDTTALPNSLEKLSTTNKDSKFEYSYMSQITSLKEKKASKIHRNLRIKRETIMFDEESDSVNDENNRKCLIKEEEKKNYPSEEYGEYKNYFSSHILTCRLEKCIRAQSKRPCNNIKKSVR